MYLNQEKNHNNAVLNYNKALKLANKNKITSKITDLNSKLASVFAIQGQGDKANNYYQNSLKLASKENKKRSLKEQQKVADFYNKSRRFDEEIQLRKESLKNADDVIITPEAKETISDSITSQKNKL